MTSHAAQVSTEAEQTGKHAADVCKDAAGLNTAVGELRHAVIRVVRTSTTEMDRRHDHRYAENLTGRVTVGGRSSQAHITDLSEHGASVRSEQPAPIGTRGMLMIDGVDFVLPFNVRAVEGDLLHLALELDEQTAARFRAMPERLAQRRTA
jgi:methyl-accepting chemotaxis protein